MPKSSLSDKVEVIDYESKYREDFYRLNCQWLEKYFHIEPIDEQVLSQPEKYILSPGGHIFLAKIGENIVGTAALIVADDERLELSKMSVDESFQGYGIGEKLARVAINWYKDSDFKLFYLESNRILKPAIKLYEKLGFEERPCPFTESHYTRADIYMEFQELL
ncbi:MAG: GNAT family N-acetyltransferase [Gammaproteobacteria bacterium]|nr:GNAT family N-acetyltransferase [Gammaproteobacteria bacterium]MDH5628891.1 GNAT family N-acetyltransferase [Gammaproteobacteria bacterium]